MCGGRSLRYFTAFSMRFCNSSAISTGSARITGSGSYVTAARLSDGERVRLSDHEAAFRPVAALTLFPDLAAEQFAHQHLCDETELRMRRDHL